MTKKLIQDGNVGIIYSTTYGSGFSSWMDVFDIEKDAVLVQAILDGSEYDFNHRISSAYNRYSTCSFHTLKVEWVKEGSFYIILENDGNESVILQDDMKIA